MMHFKKRKGCGKYINKTPPHGGVLFMYLPSFACFDMLQRNKGASS